MRYCWNAKLAVWVAFTTSYLCVWSSIVSALDPIAETIEFQRIEFNRDVRPILSDHCFACHGPDSTHRQADLRLDMREGAMAMSALVPGAPEESELVTRIESEDDSLVMPPPETHKPLSDRQKEILRRWIDQGAEYQLHWSYEVPRRPDVPKGMFPIDGLVQRRLEQRGWQLSPEADRRTLIRRLHSDLIGLPPSPEEVTAFVADESPTAYADLVERLLTSEHYGERMAIPWLDVVRYADTIGYHSDNPRNVWPYRDWVIRAFNENKPFDRFTIEQIAGDLLPDADQQSRIGSAFNRLLLTTEEGGAQPKDYEARMLADRVRAIGSVWLGQTTGCAQCHDHKFDPFTTRDFYALGAFFADVQEGLVARREDGMPVMTEDQRTQLAVLDEAVAVAKRLLSEAESNKTDDGAQAKIEWESAKKTRDAFYSGLPKCLVTKASKNHRTVRILPRGNWQDESGEVLQPAFPSYLPQPNIQGRPLNRLDLAQWLVSGEHPLTARVVMNRLWKHFFGIGLSKVLDDLGAQGEPPSNPELLDFLACEFVDSGWDYRQMVRCIVMSATYRQRSTATPEQLESDPYNRDLARQTPFRMDAELVRDYALDVAGLLKHQVGGASVKPYQPEGYWEHLNFPTRTYQADAGANQYRRGLYTWWQRSFLHPSMLAFDAPTREECCAERTRSNIPQQALVLLNDPTFVEAARGVASRMLTADLNTADINLTADDDADDARIAWGFSLVLQRTPTADERQTLRTLVNTHREIYSVDRDAASALLTTGLAPVPPKCDAVELAVWTHVARVLLSLHETITRS